MAIASTEIENSYWQGAFAGERALFSQLKSECDDYKPTKWVEPAKEKDKADFTFDDTQPEMMLTYRGHKLPIYVDDYGQCYFTRINNAVWSGGAYNIVPEYEFCDFADRFIDEELLK